MIVHRNFASEQPTEPAIWLRGEATRELGANAASNVSKKSIDAHHVKGIMCIMQSRTGGWTMGHKRIIKGKSYNTDTSTVVHEMSWRDGTIYEGLYQTKHVASFIYWYNEEA
jgi:hypothetical protein